MPALYCASFPTKHLHQMIRHRRRKIEMELNGESRFQKLKEDIRINGIKNPIVLKRNNMGQLVAHIGARRLLCAN